MFGVLQIVLGENPIAAGGRIAGQLLIFLVDALGGAADLDALGAIGVEGAVGVVLLLAAVITAAAGTAIASALALHALEITHRVENLLPGSRSPVGVCLREFGRERPVVERRWAVSTRL